MIKKNCSIQTRRRAHGAGLLDVVIGILIFVVGMLALASMQGNLTRSSTDAKVRTVGSNLAEEIIEGMRTYDRLRADAACPDTLEEIIAGNAFQCVEDVAGTVTRNGVDYAITVAVDDYFFLPDGVTVTTDPDELPAGRDTTISDFKYVEVAVDWGGTIPDFITGNEQAQTSNLGSGSFALSSIIASAPPMGAALVAAEDEAAGTPPVAYIPGDLPDIVRINVNGNKFRESTTPQPDVIRSKEGLVETWFDVVTYNQGNPSIYVRREEFLVVTCECTLQAAGDTPTGLLPTVWNGASYTTGNNGELVAKTYGVSANNQQSLYCDTCCRDHHDPANPGADEVYDPVANSGPKWSESGGLGGDHKHYTRDKGGLVEAKANDNYVEACRMVRKDGFMRVAQDFRQEGFLVFPAGYLDTLAGVEEYSDYVTAAVPAFYDAKVDLVPPPSTYGIDFPADGVDAAGDPAVDVDGNNTDATELLPPAGSQQQLHSRGLYIDNQSAELEFMLSCVKKADATMTDPDAWRACGAPGYTDILQVLPYFEIQTTWLSAWDSDPKGTPVLVFSEPLGDNNTHDRGLAKLVDASAVTTVDAWADMYRGNVGLTSTAAITLAATSEAMAIVDAHLYIAVGGGGPDIPSDTYSWSGSFSSSVNKVDALGVTITPNVSEFCALSPALELVCATPNGFGGSIIISAYTKKVGRDWLNLWICPETQGPAGITVENYPGGPDNYAVVSWNALPNDTETAGVILTIEDSACP